MQATKTKLIKPLIDSKIFVYFSFSERRNHYLWEKMSDLRKRKNTKVLKPPQVKHKESDRDNVISSNSISSFWSNLGKFFLFVVAVPPMLNYASLRKERDFLISNATQYDVGFGQKLYLSCVGEGSPTVILDAPTGMTSDSWSAGMSELSAVTRVCVYDRAGLGWSDFPPRLNRSDPGEAAVARTLGQEGTVVRMVTDLHRLLTFAYPQHKPFVLVGSELGGLVARMYAHLHSADVAHLVMIDPLSETLFDDVSNTNDSERTESPWLSYMFGNVLFNLRLLQVAAMTGLARLGLVTGLMNTPSKGDGDGVKLKHLLCDPFHIQVRTLKFYFDCSVIVDI